MSLFILIFFALIGLGVLGIAAIFLSQRQAQTDLRESLEKAQLQIKTLQTQAAETLEDIEKTEQKTNELQTLLTTLPVPVWMRDPSGKITWCNAAYAALLNTTPEEVVESQHEINHGAKGKGSTGLSTVVVKGARRAMELVETPLPALQQSLGYALDRTIEAELKTQFKRYEEAQAKLLDHLGSPIAIYGADTRLKFYNQAYERLWGFDESWLNTHPPFGDVLEDLRSRRRLPEVVDFQRYKKERLSLFTSLLETEESLLHLPDGVTLRMLIIPYALGGLIFVFEDVTSRLALESSYSTLMEVQKETLNNLAEGVAVFGSNGRLKIFNPTFISLWNMKPEDLVGDPHVVEVLEKLKPTLSYEDWALFKQSLVSDILSGSHITRRLECVSGCVITLSTVSLPDGAILTSFVDITDTVRVEKALQASNQALEQAEHLKSEFLANVSAQMRIPLNAVMGHTEILSYELFGPLNDRQKEHAKNILDSCQRLLNMIEDVLDMASIDAGYIDLEKTEVRLSDVIQTITTLLQEWIQRQNLKLEIQCPADLVLTADERRLKQILFNLLSNSLKFTAPGGKIGIKAERNSEGVTLSVSDTGIGIPEEDIARMFGKFERSNTHTGKAGAGLGLSLVKRVVELHGGHVTLQSRVNEGTTVTCTLPNEK